MKHVFIRIKGREYLRELDVLDVEFRDIGKGILHLRCEYEDYYYPLEVVESCVVRNDD